MLSGTDIKTLGLASGVTSHLALKDGHGRAIYELSAVDVVDGDWRILYTVSSNDVLHCLGT